MSFIDFYKFKHSIFFWGGGDNSYYPIKSNIFLYIISYNTVIFNQNPQNFIISKQFCLFAFQKHDLPHPDMPDGSEICFLSCHPCVEKQRFNAFFQYT